MITQSCKHADSLDLPPVEWTVSPWHGLELLFTFGLSHFSRLDDISRRLGNKWSMTLVCRTLRGDEYVTYYGPLTEMLPLLQAVRYYVACLPAERSVMSDDVKTMLNGLTGDLSFAARDMFEDMPALQQAVMLCIGDDAAHYAASLRALPLNSLLAILVLVKEGSSLEAVMDVFDQPSWA